MISISKTNRPQIQRIRKVKNGFSKALIPQGSQNKHGLFQLSHKVDYGLFLMMELAKKGVGAQKGAKTVAEPMSLRQVADEHQMSFFFLQKVANDLRNAELIKASRGKLGGYILAQETSKITLKNILEALEGPIAVMHCLTSAAESPSCVRENSCEVRPGLNSINQILLKALSETTLANILSNHL